MDFPNIKNIRTIDNNEELVRIDNISKKILYEPIYYKQGIIGGIEECYVRESLVEKVLKIAEVLLPDEYSLKVYDAWKPIQVQKSLYDKFYLELKTKYPELTSEELGERVLSFVSFPSEDIKNPCVHSTGGAIDLTILKNGKELDMGTVFDDFTENAYTNNFTNDEVSKNRKMLLSLMQSQGFTNLPTEWWHFDYGDRFWAYYNKTTAFYDGILKK